tara:strand:- start:448 stop:1215 length:768 start_codon:yes stop_codon:yes gene_type:complete
MNINFYAKKLTKAFLQNKLISPIPSKYTKKLSKANSFRKLCESKIKKPIIGFKAGGTGLPLLKKLREKEPFYASVYKHNVLKNNSSVKKNDYTLGIELEVCYIIKKNFFYSKKKMSKKNINELITHIGPCIEVVGYRQKKKGIKSFGDLCSDFGGNVKFILGKLKRFKKNNVKNLKTNISNIKARQSIYGNTNTVYKDPMNSLLFVLNKLRKEKIKYDKDFYVFTGSSVGVVPIMGKGTYTGKIDKLGTVKTNIN